jgi:hypothetical protein
VHQVVAVQPVVGRLRQHEQPEQHGQLGLGGAGESVARRLQPDPAVQVVHDRRRQQGDHGGSHREVHQIVHPRQVEDEVADVLAEVGVVAVEGDAVAPQQVVAPLPRG